MNKKETQMLFDLLEQFYPNAKQINDKTILAWSLALEPYEYEQVKKKALEFVVSHKFFPNICEIVPDAKQEQEKSKEWMKEYLIKNKQHNEESPQ